MKLPPSSLLSKLPTTFPTRFATRRTPQRTFTCSPQWRDHPQPADDPAFRSIVDRPARTVRVEQPKHNRTLLFLLALIPVAAFGLGTWQVYRLGAKTRLVAQLEDRILREPLPLPGRVDSSAVPEFDHRRVYVKGRLRHDQEMLVGPRVREGENGYLVVTPLERDGGPATKVLVNRGWIPKRLAHQSGRPDGLPTGIVTIEGLLRKPFGRNLFTIENHPERGEFYFLDVKQMAEWTESQPVFIEATLDPDYLQIADYTRRGIPVGRPVEVGLRNNHMEYIITWYGLSVATSVMWWMLAKRPRGGGAAAPHM